MAYESSMDLADRLFKLSGWPQDQVNGYSLGYLLRKLPKCQPLRYGNYTYPLAFVLDTGTFYKFGYPIRDDFTAYASGVAHTPEDAAAKLAIELFKSGVLKR